MKITELELVTFGAFQGRRFDFSGGAEGGLHLIYGSNGSGKSTTLRALRAFLYGYPQQQDAFRFPRSQLRLRGRLRNAEGREIAYCRRSHQGEFFDFDDQKRLAKEEQLPFLAGVSREDFELCYGLDYETMVEGGRQLLERKGDLGEALFAAGLGGNRLTTLQKKLHAELGELWVDRGTKGSIRELKRRYDALEKERRAKLLSVNQFQETERRHDRALAEAEEIRAELSRARVRLETARRASKVRPRLLELDQLENVLAGFEEGALIPRDLQESLESRWSDFSEAKKRCFETEARDDEARRQLEAVIVDEAVLEIEGEVADLLAKRQSFAAKEDEGGKLRQGQERQELEVARCLDALRDLGEEEEDPSLRMNLLSRRQEIIDLQVRLEEAHGLQTAAREKLAHAESRLMGAREDRQRPIEESHPSLAEQIRRLPFFEGEIDSWLSGSTPSSTTIEDYRRRFENLSDEASRLSAQRREQDRLGEAIQARSNELASTSTASSAGSKIGRPVTPTDLAAGRSERDAFWQEIRSELRGRKKLADAEKTGDAFEAASRRADDLADSLRAQESLRLQHRQLEEERDALAAKILSTEDELRDLEAARSQLQSSWEDLWRLSGIAPESAEIMVDWQRRREALQQEIENERRSLENLVRDRAEERDRAAAELTLAEAACEEARAAWASRREDLGITEDLEPQSLSARLEALAAWRDAERELARSRDAAEAAERYCSEFREGLERSAAALGLEEEDPQERLEELARRLERAKEARTLRKERQEARAKSTAETEAAKTHRDEISARLEALTKEAGVKSLEELPACLESSRLRREIEEKLSQVQRVLNDLGDGRDLATLRAETKENDNAEAPAPSLSSLESEVESLEAAHESKREEVVLSRELIQSEGSADSAWAAQESEQILAKLEDETRRYLRAFLAARLLEEEIERYRRENQDPLLARAGQIFSQLTLGAYESLAAFPDETGKPLMEARRPTGEAVKVDEGLSTGTEDQLYLALRIATLEHLLESGEPMPFIADDLFINFDDARTEAAFRVLAELAQKTQVIVFTHHRSVVEIARRLQPGTEIFEHDLTTIDHRAATAPETDGAAGSNPDLNVAAE